MSFFKRRSNKSTVRTIIDTYFNGFIHLDDANKDKSILRLCERIASIGMIVHDKGIVKFDSKATNPYCDKPTIVIPTIWTMPKFWEAVFKVDEKESLPIAICGVMGAMTHESCHNIYTDNTNLKEMAEKYGNRKDENYIKFLCGVINLVEDLFIDEEARYEPRIRRLSTFTDYMRGVTNQLDIEKTEEIKIEYEKKFAYLVSLLSLEYLEEREKLYPYVESDIVDFAYDSIDIQSYEDRVIHAVKLTDMLLDGVSEEQMEQDAQDKKNEQGISISFGVGQDGEPLDFNSLDAEVQQAILDFIEENKEEIQKMTDGINKAIAEKEAKDAKERNKQYEKVTPKVPRLAGEGKLDNDKVLIGEQDRAYTNWTVDNGWKQFSRFINNARSYKMKSPALKYNGYDIDIDSIPLAVDGEKRIFIDNALKKVPAPPQIVIRCDGSGSTLYKSVGNGKTLRQAILEAACGMMGSMVSTNVPFYAFMDTTNDNGSRESLLIYKLGCNLMPFELDLGNMRNKNAHNFYDRCRNMENTVSSGNNDGFALEYGSMFAVDKSRKKVMISLSDGAPSSSRDRNLSSEQYLVQVISNLRKQGWLVISVSLIPEVVKHNDRIYGEAFNVDASQNINSALIDLGKKLLKAG